MTLDRRRRSILKRLPLWTYRVMPYRWVCWIYRDALARDDEYAKAMGFVSSTDAR